jgi:hypothetical protein
MFGNLGESELSPLFAASKVPLVLSQNNALAETALHATLPVYVSQHILWKYEAIIGQTDSLCSGPENYIGRLAQHLVGRLSDM